MSNPLRSLPWVLPGAFLVLLGVFADQLRGRPSDGMGPLQILLAAVGVVTMGVGLWASRRNPRAVNSPSPHRISLGKKLFFSSIVGGFLIVLLEGVAWVGLCFSGSPQPFLVRWNPAPKQRQLGQAGKDRIVRMSYLDPHLGYGHNPRVLPEFEAYPGFAVYGDPTSSSALRIFALGGSTTDPVSMPDGNWPKHLHEILSHEGIECVVFNGGVGGYSSNQELLKLIRDVLPLDPDIVVALNGINDMTFIHGLANHPMVNPYQSAIIQHMAKPGLAIFPNIVRLLSRQSIEGVNFGTVVHVTDVEQWWRNARMAHAIAGEFDVAYFCCLQPTLGIGQYQPTPHEQEMLSLKAPDYLPALKEFYAGALPLIQSESFGVDLVEVLRNEHGIYADPRHPNPAGNRVIAAAIAKHLHEQGLMHPKANAATLSIHEASPNP